MNRTSHRNGRSGPTELAFTLTLAVACLLMWSPVTDSRPQQDRQLMQTGSSNADTGKRIALVIGNGAYANAPPLKNPPNDARDMAATLKALGFDVTSGINANQREMKRLIREFGQKLKAGGSGLFYYAGHGVQSKGRNYLIPVDADIASEAEVEDSGVDVGLVLNFMDDAQNGLNIVILDACRNNPFARSFRSASSGLAQVDAPTGTLIAYATAPGRVASDGPGQNGLYTSELLKQMRVPGLSATEMFMHVRAEVMKQTGTKQVPWEASSLVGNFCFAGGCDRAAAVGNSSAGLVAPPLPSVEQILGNYVSALGGQENINKLTTISRKGTYEMTGQFNMKGTVELVEKHPGKSRLLLKSGDAVSIEVYDGTNGWIHGSTTGTQVATPRQLEINQHSAAWAEGNVDTIRKLYASIRVKSRSQVAGQEVFIVEAAPSNGKIETLYFGVDSGLLLRLDMLYDSVSTQKGLAFPTQVYLEDYVEADGAKIPMTVRQVSSTVTATIKFDVLSMRFNIPLDDKLFNKPK